MRCARQQEGARAGRQPGGQAGSGRCSAAMVKRRGTGKVARRWQAWQQAAWCGSAVAAAGGAEGSPAALCSEGTVRPCTAYRRNHLWCGNPGGGGSLARVCFIQNREGMNHRHSNHRVTSQPRVELRG